METNRTRRNRRLAEQMSASQQAADDFANAARLLRERFGMADAMGDEVRRLERMSDEYQRDADELMDRIVEVMTPQEFEAL